MASICPIEQVGDDEGARFGAKARGLARLAAAGLPVPTAVCISPDAAAAEIVTAYRRLGGTVAVRSSGVVEDAIRASFAGQFETILDVSGESAVLDAVQRVRASGRSARAAAYRQAMDAAPSDVIPVILQRQIRAELAGVLLTRAPDDENALLLEAGPGLAAVTAGRDNPRRIRLHGRTGATLAGEVSLSAAQASAIAEVARSVERAIGHPALVEWAIEGDQLWVLQARPATDISDAEREAARAAEIERLRRLAGTDGTVWEMDEFCAALELPTPMTWSLLERMFSADGALGAMYADLGCAISPNLESLGVYDLLAGRPRLNRRRARQLQFGDLPFDVSGDRDEPGVPFGRWLIRLPTILWRLHRRQRCIAEQMRSFPERFQDETLPEFERRCDAATTVDLSQQSDEELLQRFALWSHELLIEFARDALKPAALAAWIVDDWRRADGESAAQRRAAAVLAHLRLDPRCDLARALRTLTDRTMSMSEFLRDFGHRAIHDWELAEERYSERPPIFRAGGANLRDRNDGQREPHGVRSEQVELLRRLLRLRELAKHVLLKGWAHLRAILLELDRRWNLHGSIFDQLPEELPRVAGGEDFAATIADRRQRRRIWRSLHVPARLSNADLEQLGPAPTPLASEPLLHGQPISPGVAQAPARVLMDPDTAPPEEPFVLVCATADPAWTPHLLRARGAIFEVGGALAHCAIVAREFGVPAVSGVADATRRIADGQIVTIDGCAGTVRIADDASDECR